MKTKDAAKYLSLYVGPDDWEKHISRLYTRLNKNATPEEAGAKLRKIVACTVLLPVYENQKVPDPPNNLLYWCSSYHQFNDRDWEKILNETMERDADIGKWRNQCQSLGIIDPIDYSPITRQAFNWLFNSAKEAGAVNDDNAARLEESFKRLVYAYGGAVICAIFQQEANQIKRKVKNWQSNYFFERLIFDIYSVEEVVKIKRAELKKANPKLVKQLRKV